VSAIAVPQEAMLKSLITAILDLSKPLALVIALFCVDTTVLSVALPTQLHKKLLTWNTGSNSDLLLRSRGLLLSKLRVRQSIPGPCLRFLQIAVCYVLLHSHYAHCICNT